MCSLWRNRQEQQEWILLSLRRYWQEATDSVSRSRPEEGQVKKSPLAKKLAQKAKKVVTVEWTLRPEVLVNHIIPLPMHGMAPRIVLGQAWWDRTRRAAYKSTNYHCIACGVHKFEAAYHQWLEGHEVYDIDFLMGRMEYVETVPLCHFCHNYIHDGRLRALLEQGKIHHAKYVAIIKHGDAVLARHSLTRERHEGPMAEWRDWRLVVDGKEYPPVYGSVGEWEAASGELDYG